MYKNMETKELVDMMVEIKNSKESTDKILKQIEVELQGRGLKELEDRNIKIANLQGSKGRVIISMSNKLSITNINKLKSTLNEELASLKLKEKDIEYSVDTDFKKALIHLYTKDYEDKITLEELIDNELSNSLPTTSKTLLMKKLKGDYDKDKKLLESMFGEEIANSLEEELYYICKIKNYERIRKYFDESKLKAIQEGLYQSIEVQEIPKLSLKS